MADWEYERYFDLLAKLKGIYISDKDDFKSTDIRIKYLRNKGVRLAWKQERKLVELTGEGTRDWTGDEKEELLEKGKVSGYEGHHINSVDDNPNLASDPDNIKFVKGRKEHLKEHNNDFKNKTHGEKLNRSKLIKENL